MKRQYTKIFYIILISIITLGLFYSSAYFISNIYCETEEKIEINVADKNVNTSYNPKNYLFHKVTSFYPRNLTASNCYDFLTLSINKPIFLGVSFYPFFCNHSPPNV